VREREKEREGESLVVDVGRLATTRDRPSALSAPSFLSLPRLGGHREGRTPPSLVVVSAIRAGGSDGASVVCEREYISGVTSGND